MSSSSILEKCCFLADSVVGDPTHYMMQQALEQAELDWRFLSFEIDQSNLSAALAGIDVLGFRGAVLAGSLRIAAVDWIAALSPRAEKAGCVGCLFRDGEHLVGDDLYGASFAEAVTGFRPFDNAHLLLVGSAREARSIACAAATSTASKLTFVGGESGLDEGFIESVNEMNDELDVDVIEPNGQRLEVPADVAVVIYAPGTDSQPGMPVVPSEVFSNKVVLVDTRIEGSRTQLSRAAAEQGAEVVEGVDLLTRETALALELWTGMQFSRAPLKEMAEEFLGI